MNKTREEIINLSGPRKGSLFEVYFQAKMNEYQPQAIRSRGVDFKITLGNSRVEVDLKLMKNKPGRHASVTRLWLDYLKNSTREKKSVIWIIHPKSNISAEDSNKLRDVENKDFEDFYETIWKNRKNKRIFEPQNKSPNNLKPKDLAALYVRNKFKSKIRIRLMVRDHRSTYDVLTMAPEIIPDSVQSETRIKSRYDMTLVFVFKDTIFEEFWKIDHARDWDKIKKLLVDDGLNRGKKRIVGGNFPASLKTTLNLPFSKINKS